MTKQAIIFDTDIGTDIDDVLALTLLARKFKSDDFAVITTNGPTHVRAKITLTLLELLGRDKVPVFTGVSKSCTGTTPFTHGKEDKLSSSTRKPLSFTQLSTWCLNHADQSITIVATGPLTSTAKLIGHSKIKSKINKIVMMGGVFSDLHSPLSEHNLQTDISSAHKVLVSGIPLFLIPLNTTIKHPLTKNEIEKFKNGHNDLSQFIWKGMKIWLDITSKFIGENQVFNSKVFLHDPITVMAALNMEHINWNISSISVDINGVITTPGKSRVSVCHNFPEELLHDIKKTILLTTQ